MFPFLFVKIGFWNHKLVFPTGNDAFSTPLKPWWVIKNTVMTSPSFQPPFSALEFQNCRGWFATILLLIERPRQHSRRSLFPDVLLVNSCLDHPPKKKKLRWWFQTCFIFTTWGNYPVWLIVFKWVKKLPPPEIEVGKKSLVFWEINLRP